MRVHMRKPLAQLILICVTCVVTSLVLFVFLRDDNITLTFKTGALKFSAIPAEWLDLNGELFFRLNTASYLLDQQKFLIFLTCSPASSRNLNHLKFTVNLRLISNHTVPIDFKLADLTSRVFNTYIYMNIELSSHFDIDRALLASDSKLNFFLTASNAESFAESSMYPVRVKNRTSSSKDIYICCETNHLNSSQTWVMQTTNSKMSMHLH